MNIPPWMLWGSGLVGTGVIVFLVHKFLGWKWALIAGGAFLGLVTFKSAQQRAEERGRKEAEERQRQADAEAIKKAKAAREAARERERLNPGVINEKDPFLRDP